MIRIRSCIRVLQPYAIQTIGVVMVLLYNCFQHALVFNSNIIKIMEFLACVPVFSGLDSRDSG
ncbi:MAG: hypothetical protein L6Q78_15700 [Bacteroidia bacterium]|nr:hypothetical protein [Bacteroidia bacterium]